MHRLLAVNNYHYARGGAEVVYLEHTRLLSERGWEVAELSMNHPQNQASDWQRYFVQELEFGNDYGLAKQVKLAAKSVYSFEAAQKARQLVQDFSPEIAHCHNIYHHLSPSVLRELHRLSVPTVLTLHDLKVLCPAYKMYNADGVCERCKGGRYRSLLAHRCMKGSLALSGLVWLEATVHSALQSYSKSVDRFVSPSQFFIDKFVEWGWPRERFTYVPNFIDPNAFTPDTTPGTRFVYFGRLSEEKGLPTLVSALIESGQKATIIGTGPVDAELKALAEATGADIEFAGYQTGTGLHDLIRAARAVVIPSEWYENAPMSVIEAYALGKPVIGADIGGIPEMIRKGETGEIFESGSVAALVEALNRFAARPDAEVQAMGEQARAVAVAQYNATRYLDTIETLYQDLI